MLEAIFTQSGDLFKKEFYLIDSTYFLYQLNYVHISFKNEPNIYFENY